MPSLTGRREGTVQLNNAPRKGIHMTKKETARQKWMREFHQAQAQIAASRRRAKGGDDDRSVHESPALVDPGQ